MKILMVTAAMETGGAETHILSLASALCVMGHKICVASSGGRLVRKLTDCGIKHIQIPLDKSNPFSVAYSGILLDRAVKRGNFDIIHAHSRLGAFICSALAKRYHIPFVTTVHASFSLSPLYKRLSRWGNISIAVSEDLRHYLCLNYGVSSENTRLIENGIDTNVFYPRIPLKSGHRIVFVSRLDRDCAKAAFSLCRIFPALSKEFSDIEIIICGGGDAYGELSAYAESLGTDRLRLLGNVENISEALQSSDLFVGVSRAALEAMACGIPTILGGNEGFLGLIESEDMLILAAASNFCCRGAQALTDKLLYSEICRAFSLKKDKVLELSALLTAYVKKNNSLEGMAKKTADVYREALTYKSSKRGKAVLLGYYGFGNLGDNALLRASVRRAKEVYPSKPISALTKAPRTDSSAFGIRCVNRYAPISVAAELWNAEVLILGGGTLLQDSTSLRSLLYYSAVIYLASARGLRIELWGNGLSAPSGHIASALIKGAMSRSHYIGLRDISSVTEALRLVDAADGDKLFFERDLACCQRPSTPSRVSFLLEHLGLEANGNICDFAVIAVKGSAGRGYIQILCNWLAELKAQGMSLVFLPMFPKEDADECRRLCSDFGGVIAEALSESDVVGLMSKSLIVCGMRLHSLIFASAADTPFVGLGADTKIESFCKENGGLFFTELY